MLQFNQGRVDDAARWARLLSRNHPNREYAIGFIRALLGLGAWKEAAEVLEHPPGQLAAGEPVLLRQRIILSLATNDCVAVDSAVAELDMKLREMGGGILPDIPPAVIMEPARTAQALCLLRSGQQDEALQLLVAARQELDFLPFPNIAAVALRTQILLAALYKATGEPEKARLLLDNLLEAARDVPVMDMEGAGFSRAMALAVRGDTQAALAEMQAVVDQGWTADWWLLGALEFDADYARFMNDPRFQALRARVEKRVLEMRESYRANPAPPAEQLAKAGFPTAR